MKTIQRFTPDYKMHAVRFEAFAREAEHGEYVKFDAHQQVVSAVEAERDALAQRVEMLAQNLGNAIWGAQEALQRVNALAVENAALKSSIDLIASAYTEGEPAGFEFDRARHIETPATDAALAAIQAQGVEKFADYLHKTAMAMCSVKPDNTTPGAYAGLARSFAAELREAK